MRTAIFLGLLFIAYAIDKSALGECSLIWPIRILLISMLAADIIDVIKKLNE